MPLVSWGPTRQEVLHSSKCVVHVVTRMWVMICNGFVSMMFGVIAHFIFLWLHHLPFSMRAGWCYVGLHYYSGVRFVPQRMCFICVEMYDTMCNGLQLASAWHVSG